MKFQTPQEEFWAGSFGNEYIDRNQNTPIVVANIVALFSKIFSRTANVKSVIEFGANIGGNLIAIQQLLPNAELSAIEINKKAVSILNKNDQLKVYHQSILEFDCDYPRDFVFTAGVLIHMSPEFLPQVYDKLFATSRKYICIAEYYNPTPMEITYRGHKARLFKRDFAGDLLERFSDLKLIDYGFVYHRDPVFPIDDISWFLLEKNMQNQE
ncbi:MAG: pseudaminic acid biosynthesis-associated methylase [Methanoregula sp.]